MPIPFPEALRGRLTPVFNGTFPLEREKEMVTNKSLARPRRGFATQQAETHVCIQIAIMYIYTHTALKQHTWL